jgi:hypothetical protein
MPVFLGWHIALISFIHSLNTFIEPLPWIGGSIILLSHQLGVLRGHFAWTWRSETPKAAAHLPCPPTAGQLTAEGTFLPSLLQSHGLLLFLLLFFACG